MAIDKNTKEINDLVISLAEKGAQEATLLVQRELGKLRVRVPKVFVQAAIPLLIKLIQELLDELLITKTKITTKKGKVKIEIED